LSMFGTRVRAVAFSGRMSVSFARVGCLIALFAVRGFAAPPVAVELATEPGFPLGGERRWIETLQALPDVSIRVRAIQSGDRPEVRAAGSSFEVVGILTSTNQLRLKGATFGLSDRAAIAKWLDRLRAEGADGLTAPRGPFGMTADQLTALHDRLRPAVGGPTKETALDLFVRRIGERSGSSVSIDDGVRDDVRRARVPDEFEKLSCGTALAAALRNAGLVATIERRGGETAIRVTRADRATEYWPVGYAPESSPRAVAPSLFTYLQVEINDTPLAETLAAIQPRLGLPLVIDHNSLAREGIELDAARVRIPSERTYYKRILDRALGQAKLRAEIRVDEAGTAFLWITTLRRGD